MQPEQEHQHRTEQEQQQQGQGEQGREGGEGGEGGEQQQHREKQHQQRMQQSSASDKKHHRQKREKTWTCPQCASNNSARDNLICRLCRFPEEDGLGLGGLLVDLEGAQSYTQRPSLTAIKKKKNPLRASLRGDLEAYADDWNPHMNIDLTSSIDIPRHSPKTLATVPNFVYGAAPHAGENGEAGFLFNVWAPRAEKVHVIGDFNDWNNEAHPMKKQNSHFSCFIPGAVDGQHYKYLFKLPDASEDCRNDPRSVQHVYRDDHMDSILYDPKGFEWHDASFSPPSFNTLVLYELHVGSFGASAKGLNDGTFLTCIERFDHLVELGINGIQLLPITQDCHTDCWGYDPVSMFAVHAGYGTPNDLKSFIDAAHAKGISVVMDWVPNHFSSRGIMKNWDAANEPGSYFYSDKKFRHTEFGPRPDFSNFGVREYLRDSLYMWLMDFHFDGVRVDSTITMRVTSDNTQILEAWTLMQELNAIVRSWSSKKILIAEDLQHCEGIHTMAGFDSQWDAEVFHILREVCSNPGDEQRDMNRVERAIIPPRHFPNPHSRIIYLESHDTIPQNREKRSSIWISGTATPEKNFFSLKRSSLMATVLMTIPGIPMLCMGQELFESCGGVWPEAPPIDFERKEKLPGFFLLYRHLVHLRCNSANATAGLTGRHLRLIHKNNINKVMVWHRYSKTGPGDDVIILSNFSNKYFNEYRVGVPRNGKWYTRLNTDDKVYSEYFEGRVKSCFLATEEPYDGYFFSLSLLVPRYSAIILSQDPLK